MVDKYHRHDGLIQRSSWSRNDGLVKRFQRCWPARSGILTALHAAFWRRIAVTKLSALCANVIPGCGYGPISGAIPGGLRDKRWISTFVFAQSDSQRIHTMGGCVIRESKFDPAMATAMAPDRSSGAHY